MILVDDGDRTVVDLLRIALRLTDDCDGERVDDEAKQHEVMREAAQFLQAKPEYVADTRHQASSSALVCARAAGSSWSAPEQTLRAQSDSRSSPEDRALW